MTKEIQKFCTPVELTRIFQSPSHGKQNILIPQLYRMNALCTQNVIFVIDFSTSIITFSAILVGGPEQQHKQ